MTMREADYSSENLLIPLSGDLLIKKEILKKSKRVLGLSEGVGYQIWGGK